MTEQSRGSIPEKVGQYRIERPLAAGGMGWVYIAHDTRDGRKVAIKLMHEHLAADAGYRQRFGREARISSLFRSENTVRVLDFGQVGGRLYMVMEYVDGPSLRTLLKAKRLSVKDAVRVARGIAAGLAEAEHHKVVHRDIKPENVLLSSAGVVKVADFGIAAFHASAIASGEYLESRVLLGALPYMAPEALIGKTDHRSDIYSLGVVLFEMLTGRAPYKGDIVELMRHHQETPVPVSKLEHVVPRLRDLVTRCMAKDRNERPQTAVDVMTELAGIASDMGFGIGERVIVRNPRWLRILRIAGMPAGVAGAGMLVAAVLVLPGILESDNRCTLRQPQIFAEPVEGKAPLQVKFVSPDVISPSCPGVGWLWDFGDGTRSSVTMPAHTYELPKTYQVFLTITDSDNSASAGISIDARR